MDKSHLMKKFLVLISLLSLGLGANQAFAATGDVSDVQSAVLQSLTKLVQSYEGRLTTLEDEVNRLRIENESLRARLGTGTIVTKPTVTTPAVEAAKTPQELKYNAIMSNINVDLMKILTDNNLTATGSIGLFEFIEPDAFFISIDDGANPAGVTAFKTKILFKYDANLKLTTVGVFSLDYASGRYVTLKGSNPYTTGTRIRVKNPAYKGKLLEEKTPTTTDGTITATKPTSPTVTIPPTTPATGTGSTDVATLDAIRKAYEKNKLGPAVELATSYLAQNPGNVEVLTIRARSYYIIGNLESAIVDIKSIYAIQKDAIDCGIVNDGARAEKSLKGAKGTAITDIQTAKCKKK